VKVLDFGLVKALDESKLTRQANDLAGTPLYMSPEAFHQPQLVGPRSDLYAVGAIGYFLLTGQPVFNGRTLVALCHEHINTTPEPPSQRLQKPVAPELESALLSCLAKQIDHRPPSARDLSVLLSAAATAGSWTPADADAWWREREQYFEAAAAVTPHPEGPAVFAPAPFPSSPSVYAATAAPVANTAASAAPQYFHHTIEVADVGIV